MRNVWPTPSESSAVRERYCSRSGVPMPENTEFPKATYRYDPYRNHRFRVKWDGRYVAGISKVSPLTRTTEVVIDRAAGDPTVPRRMPGQT